jgi:hypothetical protein
MVDLPGYEGSNGATTVRFIVSTTAARGNADVYQT